MSIICSFMLELCTNIISKVDKHIYSRLNSIYKYINTALYINLFLIIIVDVLENYKQQILQQNFYMLQLHKI